MGKWAEEQGKKDAFHLVVFKSYFVEEKNIGDAAVLVNIAEKIGLSKKSAQDVFKNRSFQEGVDQDWERSKMVGITAVPTFIMRQQRLVGAQSYDDLKRFVGREV
jgi:predicted DsbA family dithiol-disulfide isomerase